MALAIRSRGPDASGTWTDPEQGVALGHRRLAILDLSREGEQPKASASGRYKIVYNGEIYNFRALRKELEQLGHTFKGSSDTEVLLAAIEQWSVEGALPRLVGMFAFGVWDREARKLTLARDRAGEKPLYYGWNGGLFFFASELKSLRAHPRFSPQLDHGGLTGFLRFGYVPDPFSVFEGIRKLRPGHLVEVDPGARSQKESSRPYWRASDVVTAAMAAPLRVTESEAISQLDELLRGVVAGQMVSDVPRGVFLSGGIDSSLITALAQTQSRDPVSTFSIGFDLGGYDEAVHAKAVAKHLGTDHHELYLSAADALAVIPKLSGIYDEPFADSSQIPTYLLCKMARRHVTVCLSGEGGDEIFGGYNRYLWVDRVWRIVGRSPKTVRQAVVGAIHLLSPAAWSALYQQLPTTLLPELLRVQLPGNQLYKLANVLSARDRADLYHMLISCWNVPGVALKHADSKSNWPGDVPTTLPGRDFIDQMMLSDFLTYLPGDVLVKVDRAAMANSLESRVPYLDHRVMEFSWRLPNRFRVRGQTSKWILRQLLDRYVPRELVDRPKMGFGVPLAEWLRGPLRDWAESLLDEAQLNKHGLLRADAVRALWHDHLSQRQNAEFKLWSVLMLQDWLRNQTRSIGAEEMAVSLGPVPEG